jgi:glutamate formiminotransferase/formiminotetrahydrofolate cyclodeaminase
MGLNELHPFRPEEKIIEYVMEETNQQGLINMSLTTFMNTVASESPVPGGGSVSAYMGALGIALGTMVANLSSHKKGWDDRWKEFSEWAVKGKEIQNKLLSLVDEDTEAYKMIIAARRLPKNTMEEINKRNVAIQDAFKEAILVPLRVMETAYSGFDLIRNMVEKGNPSSVSDAAVGSLALLAAINGAFLNVKINSSGVEDKEFISSVLIKGNEILSKSRTEGEYIQKVVDSGIRL